MLKIRTYAEVGTDNPDSFLSVMEYFSKEDETIVSLCISLFGWDVEQYDLRDDYSSAQILDYKRLVETLRETYIEKAGLLRMDPSEAFDFISCGAVDLLRVSSGLAEPFLREMFPQWLSKLSFDGVIVVDDVSDNFSNEARTSPLVHPNLIGHHFANGVSMYSFNEPGSLGYRLVSYLNSPAGNVLSRHIDICIAMVVPYYRRSKSINDAILKEQEITSQLEKEIDKWSSNIQWNTNNHATLVREVESIESSAFWRVMEPLRKLRTLLATKDGRQNDQILSFVEPRRGKCPEDESKDLFEETEESGRLLPVPENGLSIGRRRFPERFCPARSVVSETPEGKRCNLQKSDVSRLLEKALMAGQYEECLRTVVHKLTTSLSDRDASFLSLLTALIPVFPPQTYVEAGAEREEFFLFLVDLFPCLNLDCQALRISSWKDLITERESGESQNTNMSLRKGCIDLLRICQADGDASISDVAKRWIPFLSPDGIIVVEPQALQMDVSDSLSDFIIIVKKGTGYEVWDSSLLTTDSGFPLFEMFRRVLPGILTLNHELYGIDGSVGTVQAKRRISEKMRTELFEQARSLEDRYVEIESQAREMKSCPLWRITAPLRTFLTLLKSR